MAENASASQGQPLTTVTEEGAIPQDPEVPAQMSQTTNTLGISVGLPTLPSGVGVSTAATEIIDAADKRIPTLSLNARRKSFHGLAVIMFLPGIAFDVSVPLFSRLLNAKFHQPAFSHLAFSVAFAAFIFAEYIRYFALYPLGAAIHVFLSEFVDAKDCGTAILSHFYLLTGCAGSVWLEGSVSCFSHSRCFLRFDRRSQLLGFTGVLVLGIGDAMVGHVPVRFYECHLMYIVVTGFHCRPSDGQASLVTNVLEDN